ncbi:MAG: VCBS repeat-containing protein [Planctomycetes bacterium]|nr:VCBS repeat-containing protein [Planctomycetota bacterium]
MTGPSTPRPTIVCCLALLCIGAPAATVAQQPRSDRFVELRREHVTLPSSSPIYGAAGDVDRDGDVDLVVDAPLASNERSTLLLLNDGRGVLTPAPSGLIPPVAERTQIRLLVDVDGNRTLDLVLGAGLTGQSTVLLNQGFGRFSLPSQPALPPSATDLRQLRDADLDGDGDPDLIGVAAFELKVWRNDGSGRFTDDPAAVPAGIVGVLSIATGDLNGDGAPDVIAGINGAEARLLLNDGAGRLIEAPGAIPALGRGANVMELGDLDADGDLDLVHVGGFGLLDPSRTTILRNDGSAMFAVAATLDGFRGAVWAVGLADFDGDGDVDVLESPPGGGQMYLRRNLGQLQFATERVGTARFGSNARWLSIADFDGDGDPDVATPTDDVDCGVDYWVNDVGQELVPGTLAEQRFRAPEPWAWGDLDGRGGLDLVGIDGNGAVAIALNDGVTGILQSRALTAQSRLADAVLADVDADGDLDLWLVSGAPGFQQRPQLFLNDGAGAFTDVTAMRVPLRSTTAVAAASGDWDRDGDQDLFVCGDPCLLFENLGGGSFRDASWVVPASLDFDPGCVDGGDVDGDGREDLVIVGRAPAAGVAEVWRYDPRQGFVRDQTAFAAPRPFNGVDCALLDADGDGDLDLAVAGFELDGLWRNDGSGRFAHDALALDVGPGRGRGLQVTDLDDDGDPDLIVRQEQSENWPTYRRWTELRLLANVAGGFVANGMLPIGNDIRFAAVDLDDDRDPDVVAGFSFWSNRTRQASASLVTRAGGGGRFTIQAVGISPRVALPLVAAAASPAPIPTPFGNLRLAAGQQIALRVISLEPAGRGDYRFVLPDDPALVGRQLLMQALVVDGNARIELTNLVIETLRR